MDPWKRYSGEDYRRSSRVKCQVPLLVYGQDFQGEKFVEKTHAIDVNLHGCGFISRHNCLLGSFVTLRFGGEHYSGKDKVVRAQVKRSELQPNSRKLYCVGVELGMPGNVWSYSPVPPDWRRLLSATPAVEPSAAPALLTPDPPAIALASPMAAELAGDVPVEIHLDFTPGGPAILPTVEMSPAAINQEQIESAVTAAISKQMESAITRALSTLDLQTRASLRQIRENTHKHVASEHSIGGDLEALLNDRLTDLRAHWDHQLDGYLICMEECVKRMERQAAMAEERLNAAREAIDKTTVKFSQQLDEQVTYAVHRAAQAFAERAASSVDHQLVRLTEDAHFVAREIHSTVGADSAAAQAEMRKASQSMLEELRTESEAYARLLAADTKQKLTSTLAALEAEHHSRCEARRKTIDEEFVRAGANISEEFRHSFKAFFYSCIVAAVGAVEQHAKTTLDDVAPDTKPLSP